MSLVPPPKSNNPHWALENANILTSKLEQRGCSLHPVKHFLRSSFFAPVRNLGISGQRKVSLLRIRNTRNRVASQYSTCNLVSGPGIVQ